MARFTRNISKAIGKEPVCDWQRVLVLHEEALPGLTEH
ncbi:hypothetical protein UC8_47530 [Roseimaritima ulvae]|uniref:Uncharacterized protein n=1 Tax=Roseimaritima ulvae TaxID=980254 RepID=A0A5B9R7M3_9BACT|nr:hypothetical protein UC8_47530 [Roseimaritima ulvae]